MLPALTSVALQISLWVNAWIRVEEPHHAVCIRLSGVLESVLGRGLEGLDVDDYMHFLPVMH